MNKSQVTEALRNLVEVAVYCNVDDTGRRGRRPARMFDHNDSYKLVVRCKIVAMERRVVRRRRSLTGAIVSREPESIQVRVMPLGPLPLPVPTSGPEPSKSFTPGIPDDNYYGRTEYITTDRMIIGTWADFERDLEAHLKAERQAATRPDRPSLGTRVALGPPQ